MKTIKDLPKIERPRERLEKFGSEALSALRYFFTMLYFITST